MGACVTKHPAGEFYLDQIRTFDIVLIRSKLDMNGFKLDTRLNDFIKGTIHGVHMPPENDLAHFDRVGIAVIASDIDQSDNTYDNIYVMEATATGVKTQSLRDLCNSSLDTVIRHVYLSGEVVDERKAKMKRKGALKQQKNEANKQVLEADQALKDKSMDKRKLLRVNFDKFCDDVSNRPYEATFRFLLSMFDWVTSQLKKLDMQPEQIEKAAQHVKKNEMLGESNTETKGLNLDGMMRSMHDICLDTAIDNSISYADTTKLVQRIQENGMLGQKEFLVVWQDSFVQYRTWSKLRPQILNGGFVSEVFIRLGLLKIGEYFIASDFSNHPIASDFGNHPNQRHNGFVVSNQLILDGPAIRSLKDTTVAIGVRVTNPI